MARVASSPPKAGRGYGHMCPQSLPREQILSAPWLPSFELKTEAANQMSLFFLPLTVPWCGAFLHSFQGLLSDHPSHMQSAVLCFFLVHCGGQHCNNTMWYCLMFSQLDIKFINFSKLVNSPKKWAYIHYLDYVTQWLINYTLKNFKVTSEFMRLSFSWFVDILLFLDSLYFFKSKSSGARSWAELGEKWVELGESWAAHCRSCRNTQLKHQAPNEGVK